MVSRESLDALQKAKVSCPRRQSKLYLLFSSSGLVHKVFLSFSPLLRLVSFASYTFPSYNDFSHIDSKPIEILRDKTFLQKLLIAQPNDVFSDPMETKGSLICAKISPMVPVQNKLVQGLNIYIIFMSSLACSGLPFVFSYDRFSASNEFHVCVGPLSPRHGASSGCG
jgi:hypothetical protein